MKPMTAVIMFLISEIDNECEKDFLLTRLETRGLYMGESGKILFQKELEKLQSDGWIFVESGIVRLNFETFRTAIDIAISCFDSTRAG